ncbi:MAG: crotonase/enoyl-CoA hydratase family protein [Betaproteobacteria bacterium]
MDMTIPHALLKATEKVANYDNGKDIDFFCSEQLSATYNIDQHAVWLRLRPQPRPSFNPELLRDLSTYCHLLAETRGRLKCRGTDQPVEYAILASATPHVFNLGGDLALFMRLIEAGDREGLTRYGKACVDVLYRNYRGHDLPILTVSLVQGECLGGGFEAALSSDIIIAERGSRFGFPEILFNLFPGMGAYSFLARRVGRKLTEELISGGQIHSADDMLRLGVVDIVVDDGEGETGVEAWIRQNRRSRNGMAGIARARRRVSGIDLAELIDVVGIWVDAALNLSSRDLKLMQRLVTRQNDLETRSVH